MQGYSLALTNLRDFEVEDLSKERLVLLLISTYENGEPPDDAKWFCRWVCFG